MKTILNISRFHIDSCECACTIKGLCIICYTAEGLGGIKSFIQKHFTELLHVTLYQSSCIALSTLSSHRTPHPPNLKSFIKNTSTDWGRSPIRAPSIVDFVSMIRGSLSGNHTFFVVFPTAFADYMKICR